jgi:hypothetical protein
MAISPADFYAYSRATGVPIPEDPAERMEMAPEVMEFRRNQLKAPSQERQQGPDLLSLGLGAGLALAGGAGAFLGARRLMRGPKQSATSGVQTANLAEMAAEASPVRRVVQESQPAPSRVAPQVGEQEFVAYRPDPKEMVSRQVAEARRQSATESLLKAAESRRGTYQPDLPGTQATLMALRSPLVDEAAGVVEAAAPSRPLSIAPQQESLFSPRSYIEQSGAVAPAGDLTSLQQQSAPQIINQKINAVESGEDQMTGRIKSQLQRNEDLDLASIEQLENQTNSIDVAAASTADGLPVDQAELTARITPQEQLLLAREEMIARRQSLEQAGFKPGTVRFERALAQPFRTSATAQVTGTQPLELALPVGPIRATVEEVSAVDPLIERSVSNIGPQAVLTSTAAGTAIRGASPSYHEAFPKQELRQTYGTPDVLVRGAPDELGQDIPGSLRVRGGVAPDVDPEFLSKQEIQYASLNRPGVTEREGGSAGIGVYGLEPAYVPGAVTKATGEYSEAASRKPTYVPGWLQKKEMRSGFESLSTPQLSSAAQQAKSPSVQSAIENELNRRQATKESLAVSETLRRARIEGRDPQEFLRRQLGGNI